MAKEPNYTQLTEQNIIALSNLEKLLMNSLGSELTELNEEQKKVAKRFQGAMMEDQFFLQSKGCEHSTLVEARELLMEKKAAENEQKKSSETT